MQNLIASSPHQSFAEHLSDLILGIDHLAVAVENLDESIAWYKDTLGFSLMERRVTQGKCTSMLSAVIRAGGATIVLVQGAGLDSQVSRFLQACGPGIHHVAFAVKDMDAAVERIKQSGVQIDTPVTCGMGVRQIFLHRDPRTGVRVELIERGGDYDLFAEQNVERLFRALEENELY